MMNQQPLFVYFKYVKCIMPAVNSIRQQENKYFLITSVYNLYCVCKQHPLELGRSNLYPKRNVSFNIKTIRALPTVIIHGLPYKVVYCPYLCVQSYKKTT